MLTGAVGACGDAPVSVQVRVTVDGAPVPGLEMVALPYRPSRLLDSLAETFEVPRPDFDSLEQALLAFTLEPAAADDTSDAGMRATRDSVARLADSLRASDRRSRGYAEAYRRFRQLYGRLVERSADRGAVRSSRRDVLRALALRAGQAADSLRAWERGAYAGFDSAATRAVGLAGRAPAAGVTDADGWVTLSLPPGAWWLNARLEHLDNPFAEYVWEREVVTAWLPFRVPFTERTARIAWRH